MHVTTELYLLFIAFLLSSCQSQENSISKFWEGFSNKKKIRLHIHNKSTSIPIEGILLTTRNKEVKIKCINKGIPIGKKTSCDIHIDPWYHTGVYILREFYRSRSFHPTSSV